MREIKFRAWDKERGFMTYEPYYFEKHHYSDKNRVNQCTYVYYEDWRDLEDGRYHECELMQFTGLKDKNGKEIFEGDILNAIGCELVGYNQNEWGESEIYADSKGKVHYVGAGFCFDGHSAGDLPLDTFDSDALEVIGNIHENPELLNQGV